MEKIRRALKIFWLEHGTPILFWSIVIIVVICIVQGLNSLAIKKEKNKMKENNINNIYVIDTEENKKNIELINSFLEYCKNKQIKQAYNLLSENCKNDLYPTLNEFLEKYYNKLFNKHKNTEVKYQENNGFYKVTFYEDMLESGKIDGRDFIIDYYKIEEEILESKVYINLNYSIK